jgi:NDP-sugar pyrophosphorylase family protein
MKAMILAAGLGTRLRPLTDNRPKALVELSGRTLLEITLSRLRTFGVTEVIVNVHHFADMVIDYLRSNKNFGMRIEISREDVLLDTGGGLKKAAWFFLEDPSRFDEPFLLHNVDVISNIDLGRMLQFHSENRALATLAVQSRDSSRLLLFNDELQLSGRSSSTATPGCAPQGAKNSLREGTASAVPKSIDKMGASAPEGSLHPLAFSGIHVISPRLLPMITEEGVFSIIPAYLRLAAQGENILAFRADEYYWRDLGKPADLSQAANDLEQKPSLK